MFTSFFGTFVTRFSVAGLNFLLMLVTARMFGAEGTGMINMLKANLAILVLLAGFSGVSSLSFLASKYPVKYLFPAAVMGNVVLSITGGLILYYYHPGIPESIVFLLPGLVFLLGLIQIQQALLLGAGRLDLQNISAVLLASATLLFLIILIEPGTLQLLSDYARILRMSYVLTLLFLCWGIWKIWNTGKPAGMLETTRACYQYGFKAQLSNLVHFFNYRLSLYFLEAHTDTASVGVFSLGISLAESIWLISQSIATVQYMRVARSEHIEDMRIPTLSFAWLSMGLAGIAAMAILLLPESVFTGIFSKDFSQSLGVMRWLLPGILAQSFSTLLAHYFAGRGMYIINLGGSLTGVMVNIGGGILLIPWLGISGAACTASAAYVIILVWQIYFFRKKTRTPWKDFLPGFKY